MIQNVSKGNDNREHYRNFDVLRLMLAAEVVIMHLKAWTKVGGPHMPFDAVGGFVAISGFLILGSFERSTWRRFAWKRLLRVGPAFVAALVLVAALFGAGALMPTLTTYATMGLVNPQGVKNGVLWSLSLEEALYAFLAIAYTLGAYKRVWPVWLFLVLATVVQWQVHHLPDVHRICRVVTAFQIGTLCYIYRDRLALISSKAYTLLFALVAVGLLMPKGYVIHLQAFAVVCFGAWGVPILKRKIDDLSYGIYIYHTPIIVLLFTHGVTGWPLWLATPAVVIPLAYASWRWLERPIMSLRDIARERLSIATYTKSRLRARQQRLARQPEMPAQHEELLRPALSEQRP